MVAKLATLGAYQPAPLAQHLLQFCFHFQIKCASSVKAGWRGMKGRIYFKSIKADLIVKKEQREAKLNASTLYAEGKIHEALEILSSVKAENMLPSLLFMKSQFFYQLEEWRLCVDVCRMCIGEPS